MEKLVSDLVSMIFSQPSIVNTPVIKDPPTSNKRTAATNSNSNKLIRKGKHWVNNSPNIKGNDENGLTSTAASEIGERKLPSYEP
ncbi:hypothetical protein GJ496_011011 [Pomphorhynchus laevis]|nr:hypothetical protein GJ496_011011 [Pomphorhynchus laevis]